MSSENQDDEVQRIAEISKIIEEATTKSIGITGKQLNEGSCFDIVSKWIKKSDILVHTMYVTRKTQNLQE